MNAAALLHLPSLPFLAHRPSAPPSRIRRLERRELLSAAGLRGTRVHCRSGCVWLTHDCDPRDVVLEAGESHCVDSDRRMLLMALEDAEVCFEAV